MDRRTWLRVSGATAAAAALPFLFQRRIGRAESSSSLVRDPRGILDLRRGLEYRVVERAFDPMTDGHRVPASPDGMACFSGPNNTWVLMRNHELDRNLSLGAFRGKPVPEAYDARAAGGVTRVVLDAATGERLSSNLVLAGTLRNCAGGPSPWGWISCEETTERGHGYAFLCSTSADRVAAPRRIPGYGRFRHEAAAVDPRTSIAYLTEDQRDGCLYRFVPDQPGDPFVGKLQALAHAHEPNFALSSALRSGQSIPVRWVDIKDPTPTSDSVRHEAARAGAAPLSRGEGIWFADHTVWICSTDGGRAGSGQVFALGVGPGKDADRLRLVVESPGPSVLDMPDNITIAPWGDIVVAEDGSGAQYVRAITPGGQVIDLAKNAKSQGELAGVCFSPDGSTLFLNLQFDGITLAIRGSFPNADRT
ncbi:MAG TPA: alkaline phosphatase PhoX [Polyangiaceae bacterium]